MRGLLLLALVAACGSKDAADDYVKKSKETEARLHLSRIARDVKDYAAERGALPAGTAGPTPATPCCSTPSKKCALVPAEWETPVWQLLKFQPLEEPRFQYSYTSDGKTFTATATGDVQCSGTPTTFTITGSLTGSDVTIDTSQIDFKKKQ